MDYKPLTKCDAHPSRQFLICVSIFLQFSMGICMRMFHSIYLQGPSNLIHDCWHGTQFCDGKL